jgi:hypothetical protein
MDSDRDKSSDDRSQSGRLQGRLVTCRVEDLRPHAAYERHRFAVSPSRSSALAERGECAFDEPLTITRNRTIIDGYCRCDLARRQGRTAVTCIEYDLTEDEALLWLLYRHRRSNGLSDFSRILLALELEPSLKEKARSNQRAGGEQKGSSRLTEAGRLDVRREIAAAAGVSVGNVSKVKQLTITARQHLLQALGSGEISIHRAWLWSKETPDKQLAELRSYRDRRATSKIKRLISRHTSKSPAIPIDTGGVLRRLAELDANELAAVSVTVVKGPGKAIYLTEDFLRSLPPCQEELLK